MFHNVLYKHEWEFVFRIYKTKQKMLGDKKFWKKDIKAFQFSLG